MARFQIEYLECHDGGSNKFYAGVEVVVNGRQFGAIAYGPVGRVQNCSVVSAAVLRRKLAEKRSPKKGYHTDDLSYHSSANVVAQALLDAIRRESPKIDATNWTIVSDSRHVFLVSPEDGDVSSYSMSVPPPDGPSEPEFEHGGW